jgi:hypothetical protein
VAQFLCGFHLSGLSRLSGITTEHTFYTKLTIHIKIVTVDPRTSSVGRAMRAANVAGGGRRQVPEQTAP